MLLGFLEEYCMGNEPVDEVVILGDLFDEWVCPAEFDPTEPPHSTPPLHEQYEQIAAATQNQGSIKAFKALAAMDKLVYVAGNHDMLADKPIIEKIFPGIRYPNLTDGHNVYRVDGIWAEHGHWYGLFNAPYPVRTGTGFTRSMLPLGYFISRVLAHETLKTGLSSNPIQVFLEWVDHVHAKVPEARDPVRAMTSRVNGVLDPLFVGLYNALALQRAPFLLGVEMDDLDGIQGLVKWLQIGMRYKTIWSEWTNTHPGNVAPHDALWCDAGDLSSAARLVFSQNKEARIVIFGHTHTWYLASNLGPFSASGKTPKPGADPIYVNSGAWENATRLCSFVETKIDRATGKHFVQPKQWRLNPKTGKYESKDLQPAAWVSCKGKTRKGGSTRHGL
jgi:UDP-2,3-diacylglucosamine pyrophosphatase LpxH